MRIRTVTAWLLAGALVIVLFGGCANDGAPNEEVEDVVRASVRAENTKDIDAFLALWTDKGLKAYDVGSRKELADEKSEQAEGFGEEQFRIVQFASTDVREGKATTSLDLTATKGHFAHALYRLQFELATKDGNWMLDGFKFVGSPPASKGTEVLDIKALEYGFVLRKGRSSGDITIKFSNIGKQQHELTFFEGPDGVNIKTAKKALENLDGGTLDNLPKGYKADHLSFSEPGESLDVTFAEPLASGTYVFACYVPDGGFNDKGPVNPKGKPHIQLGMINTLTVE